MITALKCPNCSAALPTPSGSQFVACTFCGATAQLHPSAAPTATRAPTPEAPGPYPSVDDRKRFGDAFAACTLDGMALVPALENAARLTLAAFGDQRAIVYIVAHLLTDFVRDTGVSEALRDAAVVQRLLDASYKVSDELLSATETEVNLPFLYATPNGPVHLIRQLTAADLARMGSAPPEAQAAPAPTPEPEPEPKKKKGWFW